MDRLISSQNVVIKIAEEIQEYHPVLIKMAEITTKLFNINNISISFIFFKTPRSPVQASTWKVDEKNYIIYFNINNLSKMRFVELFLHEFKHIQQYSNKKLQKTEDGYFWNGKFFSEEYVLNPLNYESLPWEKESFSVEFQWDKLEKYMNSKMISQIRSLVSVNDLLTP